MFCTNCGVKIIDKAKFCASCGESIVNKEPARSVKNNLNEDAFGQAPIIADINCSACSSVSLVFVKNVRSTIILFTSASIGLISIYLFLQSRINPTGKIEDLGFLVFLILAAGINFMNKYKVFQCRSCGEYSAKMRFGDTIYPVKLNHLNNPLLYISSK